MASWGQLNLSWLTSILFPPRADLGKTSQQVVSRSPPPKRMCAKDVKKLFANHMIHAYLCCGFLLSFEAQTCPSANSFQTARRGERFHQ